MTNCVQIEATSEAEYKEDYKSHLFEQYKLYLEMADRISSRRQSANTFFLTLNTALISITAYAKELFGTDFFFYFLVSISGMFLCYIWYRLVLSYKNLNSAKFKVIAKIEEKLPLRLYDAEWDAVGRGTNKSLYHPFTSLEMRVPKAFAGIHLFILLYVMPWGKVANFICALQQ